MEYVGKIYLLLIMIGIIWGIIRVIIINPIRQRKIKAIKEESIKWSKKISSTLQHKYDIDFFGNYTLQIYDFIKTNIEYVEKHKIKYQSSFNKEDLIKYIHLDEVSSAVSIYNYSGVLNEDKTEEAIEWIIYSSLIEIKNYLYRKGIHFPYYELRGWGNTYKSCDNNIKEEEKMIKSQIENINKSWKYTKIKHYFYFLLSFVIMSFIISSILNNTNYISISIGVIVISSVVFFWKRDTVKYRFKIEPLNQKLENLVGIPNDTYSLDNNEYGRRD